MKCKHLNLKEIYKKVPRFDQEAIINAFICENCGTVLRGSVRLVEPIKLKKPRKKRKNKVDKKATQVKEVKQVTEKKENIKKKPVRKPSKNKKSDKTKKAQPKEVKLGELVKSLCEDEQQEAENSPRRSNAFKMVEAYSNYFEEDLSEGDVFVKK